MTLVPGVRLGPYEVVGALGAGGMGEVYRATDTRLDRTVAIKVLPAHVAADPTLRERFEREARAVGGLSHPNICTLHDVGRQRPASGAEAPDESEPQVDFLVMECLDGETLARRLERRALPLDEALDIAGDIAEALDAAHRATRLIAPYRTQGIVHRDLKPGNVMLASTGVKLLDFGLARLREPEAQDDPSAAPTRAALTVEGSLLGTLQYMSPEQLDGKPVDARSDVFAFGAMLYEMLTGARPFDGDGQASVIGSILKDEPAPLREVRPRLPRRLDRLVRTCLDRAGNEEPLPLEPALYRVARVSPDGRRIVLDRGRPNARDLWVFDVERDTLSPLFLDPGDDESPVWTPDGRRIVFTSGRDGEANLHLRAADGTGPVERLSASEDLQWPQSWSPDGRTLVFSRRVRTGPSGAQTLDMMMMRLDADRTVSPLLASEFTESNPAVSPDGGWIAYRSDESGRNEVYVQRFPEMGGRVQISTAGGTAPLWSSDSAELFYREGEAMMAVAVDGSGAAFSAGPPVRLFEGRFLDDLARNYDVAPDGRFLMIKQADTLRQIHVVVNWMEDLRPFLGSS